MVVVRSSSEWGAMPSNGGRWRSAYYALPFLGLGALGGGCHGATTGGATNGMKVGEATQASEAVVDGGMSSAQSAHTSVGTSSPPLADFNQECRDASDCVSVPAFGATDNCTNCKSAAISRAALSRYQTALEALIRVPRNCPCPPAFVACESHVCKVTDRP